MATDIKAINVEAMQHMNGDDLQSVQAQVVNRMLEVTARIRELAPTVQEHEGLKGELAALKSIKDGIKSMMENLPSG